ncbi:conserved unknown protein [Ectocarpus siliculosus]|uniref:C2 domain-containing protein n=1 Tax=Ectocarpus siliculosus TaxID=2880 RepID=D8LF87_ECTSI|nr:conserved unknown protein [Ectocarpus siliculosus]|eukprot:CBN78812.1 conserved unknown protein [Ectocarpus siliculosus]
MPEWTGVNKNVAAVDVSPPSSPESSTSLEPRGPPRPPLPSAEAAPAESSTSLEPGGPPQPRPPLPSGAAPAEAPPAEAAPAEAPAAAVAAESGPPSPPSTSAPAPPPPVSQAARQLPQSQSRRLSLTVRPPSYGELTGAADPQTGPEPSPAGSVVPAREEKSLPAPALEEQQPPLPPPRPPQPERPSRGGDEAGAGGRTVAAATPPAKKRAPRGSPRAQPAKGTPARRGKPKKKAPEPEKASAAAAAAAAAAGTAPAAAGDGNESAGRKPRPAASAPAADPTAPAVSLARRMLDVEVVEAAGLLGTEKGGVSNPRANILLVDLAGRAVKSEGVRHTPVIKGTTNPVWNFKTSFGYRANLSAPVGGNMPTLRVQVFSEQRFAAEKPLGTVDVPLVNLSVDGEEWEQFYSLEPFGRLRAGGRLGSVHLRLKIGAVIDKRDGSSKMFLDLNRGLNDRGDEEPGYLDQPPNFLKITLHQGQDLLALDMGTSSDPLVIFKLGGKEQRSRVIQKNLNPQWEEVFEFECRNSGESLEITVEDEDRFVNDFMGFVSILMGDLEDKRKMRQWYDLKLRTGELPAGEERGAIEITTQWFFNPKFAAKDEATKKKAEFSVVNWLHDAESDTEEDEPDQQEDPNAQIAAKEADPEEKKKQDEEKDALLAKLSDFKVISGDYVAYVHIIEVRELKGEDLQGTSDPVVYVEAFGQKFATEVVKDRLNAVFDETFVINLRNLDQDDFKEGVFRISVMDADVTIGSLGSLKADLIGNHEVHRRWVALVDDENPEDVGIQGYLHLSIAIVGPGDRLKVHDEEADRRKEKAAEANAGGMDSLVVMPPAIEVQQKWLVTTVAKAEYMPVMDKNFGGGAGGGDFFFQFSIWDWDPVGENDLVGVYYGKLRHIENVMKETKGRVTCRWVNLYGPPLHIPETRNLKVLTRRAATLGLGAQTDHLHQYLNFPDKASTYRGRVLVMERIVPHAPKAHEKDKVAWRRKIKSPAVPKAAQYAMRIFIGAGTEIPQFTDVTNFGKNKKMWIRVSVGRYELSTEPVDNNKGVCEWYQSLQLKSNFNLTADPDQCPDLIVHLMAGTGTNAEPCSFRRFPAKELIEEKFGGAPTWIRLQEDKVLDLLVDNEFPGSVLIRMGLGPIESYITNKSKWKDEIQGLLRREAYELRVHLYQGRNLPSAESSRLIHPYLKVKFQGEAHLDMVIMGIRNMQPYKYLPMQLPYCVFEVDDMDGTKRSVLTDSSNKPTGRDANFLQRIKMELQLPLDVIYAPRVKIRVYDTRLGGFNVPLVGTGRIELGKKLPWSPEYEAPLAKTFAKDALLRAITADGNDSTSGGNDNNDPSAHGSDGGGGLGGGSASHRRGGLQWGSSGDYGSDAEISDFEGEASVYGAGGGAKSGFGGGKSGFGSSLIGGSTRTNQAGSGGRTSTRAFGGPAGGGGHQHARSSRSRSRSDFGGGGGGALGVMHQSSWNKSGTIDNSPQLNASGKVIDTGIGVMPALELARQKAGFGAGSIPGSQVLTPVGGGAGGALGDAGGFGGGGGSSVTGGGSMAGALGLEETTGWDEEDDELSQVPEYLKGREELEQSLEEELMATPFESYDLFRGKLLGGGIGGSTLKKVGKLKCIVRVTEGDPDDEPLFVDKKSFPTLAKAKARNDIILAELLKPKGYKVRLYILQALNLTPMDIGIGGRPGKSDPYLKVKLGKESFDDKKNYIDDVTDADFYKCVEINGTLPGASQLEIDVMDYDDIGRDELIGRTVIDLEDRWFDTRWQAWGIQNRSEDMNNMRFQTKPLETRTLLVPTSLAPQGQLRCWLDIMSAEDARAFPPDDVSLPPNRDFEVRVVFWKCKDVVAMDTVTEQNDLFVKSWVEGCDAQETDTHWFAKKGKGSFNWRMKFKVSLGPRTRAWKFPYLTVQLWDRDLFKFNDHIAEGQLDLGPYFIKAYKSSETVKLFPTIDPKLEAMREADVGNMDVDAALEGNDTSKERLLAQLESGPAAYDPERGERPPPPAYNSQMRLGGGNNNVTSNGSEIVSGVNNLYEGSPVPDQQRVNGVAPAANGGVVRERRRKKKKKKGCCALICKCCCPGKSVAARVEPGDSSDEDEEAKADAKAFVNTIKNMTGLWDDDPDESYWLNMERTNYETGQKEQMGKCLMGVQIWPIEKAELQPVGNGRNDPNSQPFLPPPAGRLRFSLNPFVMGSELFGPKICAKIACVCCCVISILLLVYFSGFFNLLLTFALSLIQ